MRRIGILGDIGSGKSYIANSFGYPVFNADQEVGEIYKKNKKVFLKLKKILPKYIYSFPINKFVILDIPLLLENRLNKKSDILIFIDANKKNISKKLKKRKNFNLKLFYKFKKIQLPLAYKKQKSDFIIKNNFSKKGIKKDINKILNKIL